MFIIYHPRAYVRKIARELGVSAIYPKHMTRNRLRRNEMTVAVNWGCSTLPVYDGDMLNRDISASISKRRCFDMLRVARLPTPRVVLDASEVIDGMPFYMRGRYLGRKDGLTSGAGITIYEKGQQPTEPHDFYSQVVSKAYEVRLHVGSGKVICEQFKLIPQGSNTLIRSFDNGARFTAAPLETRLEPTIAARAREIAISVVAACQMDFGAVDMALTKNGEWVIFEVNSAPGLMQREDTDVHDMPCTYDAYLAYFKSFVVGVA